MRYFAGEPSNLGIVHALPQKNFAQLCELLREPVQVDFTRKAFHALPEKPKKGYEGPTQDSVKCVKWVAPATFKTNPGQRRTVNALVCNLLFLDIDNSDDARHLITQGWDALGELGYIVWHTARSTPIKPRLRVCVNANGIPPVNYGSAVRTVAEMLGIANVTTESKVCVQPMYWPVSFASEEGSEGPIIACNPDGQAFEPGEVVETEGEEPADDMTAPDDTGVADITFLREQVEGVTEKIAEEALSFLDPDCAMQQWIEVGAALKHQFGDEGFELWDKWSSKGVKYAEAEDIRYRWDSLQANPIDRLPVTMRSVCKLAAGRGWTNPTLANRNYKTLAEWIISPARSTEELLDSAVPRIAALGTTVGFLQRKSLLNTLKVHMNQRSVLVTVAELTKDLRKIERETAKTTGIPMWAKGVCYVSSLNVFYRHTNDRRFSPEVLDLMYTMPAAGDDKAIRPREYLMQILKVPAVENLRYDPAQSTKRFIYDNQVPYINTYRGPGLASDPETKVQAGDLFQEHIANLIRESEYQRIILDFLAYHVQSPGRKVRWAVLLQGAQGCGKTAIAVAMTAVLGRRNVKKLTATNVLDGQHNDWAYGSQMVIMEEVRVIGQNRHGVMDKLKPCISDDEISLHCKYEPVRTVPNIANYMMFTNHHDSLAVQDTDRRYFVLASQLQDPSDIERIGGEKYFDKLFHMIQEMPGGLRAFLEDWKIDPSFSPESRAPLTPYLRELASTAASPLQMAVQNALDDQPHPLVRRDLLSLHALRQAIDTSTIGNFSDQGLSSVLKELGFARYNRSLLSDGQRHSLWTRGYSGQIPVSESANARLLYL